MIRERIENLKKNLKSIILMDTLFQKMMIILLNIQKLTG